MKGRAARLPRVAARPRTRPMAVQCQPLLITWDAQGSAGEYLIRCLLTPRRRGTYDPFPRTILLGWFSSQTPYLAQLIHLDFPRVERPPR